ncbi:MAG: putative acylesterase/phospholipase RssA [Saprospiraceae bacterium]|jgi:predicted acylesterase/phospholipase RssA
MPDKLENKYKDNSNDLPITPTDRSKEKDIRNKNIQLAKDILRGVHAENRDLESLYKNLKKYSRFGLARKILYILRKKQPGSLKLYQQEAICTYKDPDLPSEEKFSMALSILAEGEDLNKTKNTETLGLLGAIYKRKWQFDSQFDNLKKSKYYYLRGHKIWLKQIEDDLEDTDKGYTGINAAYIYDLIGSLQTDEAWKLGDEAEIEEISSNFEEAKKIRTDIKTILSEKLALENNGDYKNYWVYTTLVEACVGTYNFEKAEEYWKLALQTNPDNWELESTKNQLVQLGQILLTVNSCENKLKIYSADYNKGTKAYAEETGYDITSGLHRFLEKVLKVNTEAVEKALSGKVGLALSGGGFRAAFYHIGVLAKMAEFDLLKHVEVISCVSGGSIIGAYYYLKLILLYEEKKDEEIVREDYIQLVRQIEEEFLKAVKSNIRGRLFLNPIDNIRMAFSKSYSRTNRLAKLYETYFYKDLFDQILQKRSARGIKNGWKGSIRMQDLFIFPKGYPIGDFNPTRDNWERKNKIPNLILNATALNTGHNWQFTASWMGEPPGNIVKEVDAKLRLRRMYYWEAPGKYKNMGLSEAVAASSGVPGLFPPLTLDNLYPDQRVALVDGGVHDNQGIVGLTEQECQIFFVSDSSGQLIAADDLGKNPLSILSRMNSVVMERVRECQFLDLKSRSKSSLIKKPMFVHLRKGLVDKPLDWIHCEDPHDASDTAAAFYEKGVLTKYHIRKDVQALLASVRTDLDAFNDAEAYALMYSGYMMTEYEHLETTAEFLPKEDPVIKKTAWNFESIKELAESSEKSVWLKKILSVGEGLLFKSFYLSTWLMAFAVVFGLLVIGGICWLFYTYWDSGLLELNLSFLDLHLKVSQLGTWILWIIAGLFAGKTIISFIQYKDTITTAIRSLLVAITGAILSFLIYPILNWVYLKKGNQKEIDQKKGE